MKKIFIYIGTLIVISFLIPIIFTKRFNDVSVEAGVENMECYEDTQKIRRR